MLLHKLHIAYHSLIGKMGQFYYKVFEPKLQVHQPVKFKHFPSIIILFNSKITLKQGVVLNSSNYNYHINMYRGVKLMADGQHAEIIIGENTRVHGSCIHAKKSIQIGANCLIAANCQIMDSNAHLLCMDNPADRINSIDDGEGIIIEDNVWIGAGVTILGNSHIGNGSIIATHTVVKGIVPPNCVYGGNPGRVLKQY